MNPTRILQILSAFAFFGLPTPFYAQTSFDCGSDGSFGPLIVDDTTGHRTIALPPNGILNCTTVNIAPGYELYFTKNASNTPAYILATGDVTLGGRIYVHGGTSVGRRGGDGGPGGFAGGQGGPSPSNGAGPGGGKGGWWADINVPVGQSVRGAAGFGTSGYPAATTGGSVYGNPLLFPLIGGSGGGGGTDETNVEHYLGGGGGGGALLVASNTRITFTQGSNNYLWARGAGTTSGYGGGSGGAVRLVAPTITGSATISIYGESSGGYGRIRVDTLNNTLNLLNNGDGSSGYATFGANMVVFPQNLPQLRITKAAGTDIALTQTDPVFVLLPAGAPATQTVEVQAKNFSSLVPLVAVVTPESGNRTTYNFDIDNTAGGATAGSVQVQIPAGISCRIDVWTR